MITALRATARFFDTKIGWNRIGFALSITIIAIAAVVLYRTLRDIEVRELRRRPADHTGAQHRARRGVRCRRLFHLDLLRPVRAAHDRAPRRPLSHRRARRLHQLLGRPQCRRDRVHRRRGALSDLFGLGPRRHRGGEDLLRRRPDLLARQCHRARSRDRLRPAGGERDQSVAGLVQPRRWRSSSLAVLALCRLGVAARRARSGAATGTSRCRADR